MLPARVRFKGIVRGNLLRSDASPGERVVGVDPEPDVVKDTGCFRSRCCRSNAGRYELDGHSCNSILSPVFYHVDESILLSTVESNEVSLSIGSSLLPSALDVAVPLGEIGLSCKIVGS